MVEPYSTDVGVCGGSGCQGELWTLRRAAARHRHSVATRDDCQPPRRRRIPPLLKPFRQYGERRSIRTMRSEREQYPGAAMIVRSGGQWFAVLLWNRRRRYRCGRAELSADRLVAPGPPRRHDAIRSGPFTSRGNRDQPRPQRKCRWFAAYPHPPELARPARESRSQITHRAAAQVRDVNGWRAVSSATRRYANSDQFNRLRRPRYPTLLSGFAVGAGAQIPRVDHE